VYEQRRNIVKRQPEGTSGRALRDRWEYSHVARAVCATFSLVVLVTAATL
jgi:hypothetical protein